MPHRLALLQHIQNLDNQLTNRHLWLVPPPAAGLPDEYHLRLVDDTDLPQGKSWMIVVVPGEYTLIAWSRRILSRADEATHAMIDACWTAYRALTP